MAFIALDRFFCVLYPLQAKYRECSNKLLLCIIWAIGVSCSLQFHLFARLLNIRLPRALKRCVIYYSSSERRLAFNLFCLVSQYVLPVLLIVYSYARIVCALYGRQPIGFATDEQRARNQRCKRKTTLILLCFAAIFVLSWAPLNFYYLLLDLGWIQGSLRLQLFCYWIAVSSTSLNPIAYACLNRDFMKHLRARLGRWSCCSRSTLGPITADVASTGNDGFVSAAISNGLPTDDPGVDGRWLVDADKLNNVSIPMRRVQLHVKQGNSSYREQTGDVRSTTCDVQRAESEKEQVNGTCELFVESADMAGDHGQVADDDPDRQSTITRHLNGGRASTSGRKGRRKQCTNSKVRKVKRDVSTGEGQVKSGCGCWSVSCGQTSPRVRRHSCTIESNLYSDSSDQSERDSIANQNILLPLSVFKPLNGAPVVRIEQGAETKCCSNKQLRAKYDVGGSRGGDQTLLSGHFLRGGDLSEAKQTTV
jgi:hypothetical protein